LKANIAVLVSGGGTNLQALIDAEKTGKLPSGRIALVVSDREGAYALRRAEAHNISHCVIVKAGFASFDEYDRALCALLVENRIDLAVLAGFLSIIGPAVLRAFPQRIINIHPSLLPAFGGRGFYGLTVHQAALRRGVKVSGATVHYVDGEVDGGRIIAQKAVAVREDDTAETLQRRVMEEAEWLLLPEAVETLCGQLGAE
jgi:phosphoribosylglycinamide formyltransferase-1